jgi:hypothetical protein
MLIREWKCISIELSNCVQYFGALARCNVTRYGTTAPESKLLHMHHTPSFHMPVSPSPPLPSPPLPSPLPHMHVSSPLTSPQPLSRTSAAPPHVIQSFAAATGVPGYGRIKLASVLSSRRDVDSSEDGGFGKCKCKFKFKFSFRVRSFFLLFFFLLSRLQAGRYIKSTPVRYGIMIGYGKGTDERDRNMENRIVTLVLGIYSFAAPLGGPTFVISL